MIDFNNKIHKSKMRKRYIIEYLFKASGIAAICLAITMLFVLFYSIFSTGYTTFYTHYIKLNINWSKDLLTTKAGEPLNLQAINRFDFNILITEALNKEIRNLEDKSDKYKIQSSDIVSSAEAYKLRFKFLEEQEDLVGTTQQYLLLVNSNIDMLLKEYLGSGDILDDDIIDLVDSLKEENIIVTKFNSTFFQNADSRYPELAGIKGAFIGSVYTIMLTLIFSVILSVGAAIYLEEFAPKNAFVKFIEVNINNLAAVPSIVFGLLGLIVFQQFIGISRSTPLLAALVLALMSLPTIIIASRIALSSVPNSIKQAAYGMGASKIQVITKHLLPISFPGIITGITISISRAIGETAPLLMIGMVAFMNNVPSSISSKATVFPVQILLWSDSPEIGYIEKASAAIMLLLVFLISINWLSIYLRNKLEVKF
ncbi:Phosphate transport system permease protein PstA [Candidatus Hepatincolaceae symbiont of Richtersius coronifer]